MRGGGEAGARVLRSERHRAGSSTKAGRWRGRLQPCMSGRADELADIARALIAAAQSAADPAPLTFGAVREWIEGELRPPHDPEPSGSTSTAAWQHEAAPEPGTRGVHVLAVGKAALEMADAACAAIRRSNVLLAGGLVTAVPERISPRTSSRLRPLRVIAADHPLPTERNVLAATMVRDMVRGLAAHDRLLVLISGGGSSHLTLPMPPLTLNEIRVVTQGLQQAGRPIEELNVVRKHCEQLKGGRLALLCACPITVLVLSDVIGSPLDVISSGPFAPDPSTFATALAVMKATGAAELVPGVMAFLSEGARGVRAETPKPGHVAFARVTHRVIGGNESVATAVASAGAAHGIVWRAMRTHATGDAEAVAKDLIAALENPEIPQAKQERPAAEFAPQLPIAPRQQTLPRFMGALWAGEWTVRVTAPGGTGGPSQHLALAAALEAVATPYADRTIIAAYSTDGVDGPTDAAGAIIPVVQLRADAARARMALARSDSHSFLASRGWLIRTGPTGTNLNHIALALRAE